MQFLSQKLSQSGKEMFISNVKLFISLNYAQVKSAKLQNILGSEAKLAMNRQRSQLRSLIHLVKLKMSNHVIFAELNGQVRIYNEW